MRHIGVEPIASKLKVSCLTARLMTHNGAAGGIRTHKRLILSQDDMPILYCGACPTIVIYLNLISIKSVCWQLDRTFKRRSRLLSYHFSGAEEGSRTLNPIGPQILSLICIPIPTLRHIRGSFLPHQHNYYIIDLEESQVKELLIRPSFPSFEPTPAIFVKSYFTQIFSIS